ncbi:MAG: hypothetical protein ABI255_07890 [Microbacteriaceae bacterium]
MIVDPEHSASPSRRWGTAAMRGAGLCWTGLLIVAALTGCVQAEPDFSPGAAGQLQQSVAAVTGSAAAGQVEQAIAELDALQAQLNEATASGSVDAARSARIQASIDLVRADLVSALPAPSPAPQTVPDESVPATQQPGNQGDKGNNDKGNNDKGNNDKGNNDKGNKGKDH